MKSSILIAFLSLCYLGVKAQQDTTGQKEEYILLSATPRLLSANKVNFELSFGEDSTIVRYTKNDIENRKESIKIFHTIPDGLNFMAKQGWIFASSYAIAINGTVTYHYILRKPIAVSK